MPKITSDAVRPVSIGLRQSDIDFIGRTGTGSNLGAQLRSLLRLYQDTFDNIKERPGTFLVYQKSEDGNVLWAVPIDVFPFTINKKAGWQAIPDLARKAGWVHQVVQDKEKGSVEVYLAPGKSILDCAGCKERLLRVLSGMADAIKKAGQP